MSEQIGGILVALITTSAAVIAAVLGRRTSKEAAQAAPYAEMAERLKEVEDEVGELRALLWTLVGRDARWDIWYADLTARWAHHRTQECAPARPVPEMPPHDLLAGKAPT